MVSRVFGKKSILASVFLLLGAVNVSFGYLSHKLSGQGLDMYRSVYGCLPISYLSAFAGIACVVIVSTLFTTRPIRYIGENSLLYFAWHQTLLMPAAVACLNLVPACGGGVLYKVGELLLIIAFATMCNIAMEKSRLRFMLGKSNMTMGK